MKKIKYFILIGGLLAGGVFGTFEKIEPKNVVVNNQVKLTAATDAGFEDENFYACVLESAGKEEGTILTDEELANITEVVCKEAGVTDVTGLEKLTSIRNLDLNDNDITEIDTSANTNLQMLNLTFNEISSIDVSNNTELQGLYLNSNKLTSIDVSNNTKLYDLNLYNNDISSLDVSNNTLLRYLLVSLNNLSSLDISNNPDLERFYASDNNLSSIDLTNNKLLVDIDLYKNNLTKLDVSSSTKLRYLLVSLNNLTNLDVSNNKELEHLYASGNKISSLDLSNNTKLYDIDLYTNELTSIKLPSTDTLTLLKLSVNKLTSLDVSKNPNLQKLYASSNKLTSLNLENNNNLKSLNIAFNNIGANLKVSTNNKLSYLWINENELTNYNISNYSSLTEIGTVYKEIIPVYGTKYDLTKLIDHIPTNILINNYQVYNTFNGRLDLYKVRDTFTEESTDIIDNIGATDDNEINSTSIIEGKDGGSYNAQLLATNATNKNLSNYEGKYSYNGFYEIRFVSLSSDKYKIDEDNYTIDVADDTNEEIKKNLKLSWSGATYEINEDKLVLKYNGVSFKEFSLQRISNPKTGSSMIYIVSTIMIVSIICFIIVRKNLVNEVKI